MKLHFSTMKKLTQVTSIGLLAFFAVYQDASFAKQDREDKRTITKIEMSTQQKTLEILLSVIEKKESSKSDSPMRFKGVKITNSQTVLRFTTNLEHEPKIDIPVGIVKPFKGKETIEHEIHSKGYKIEDLIGIHDDSIRITSLPSGEVFEWHTPTFGSEVYYYLSPKASNIAIRVGPVPGVLLSEFNFEWKAVRLTKSSKKVPVTHN